MMSKNHPYHVAPPKKELNRVTGQTRPNRIRYTFIETIRQFTGAPLKEAGSDSHLWLGGNLKSTQGMIFVN